MRGELFGKIGAENTGSPLEILQKAEAEMDAGNGIEAKKLFKELIDVAGANAIRFEGQKQNRSAAEAFYLQAVAYEYMEQTKERDANYQKVIDGLLSYAKSALQFNENEKAITSATLAGMVSIVSGNNNRAYEIYTEFTNVISGKVGEESLKGLLNSLGFILDAIQNTNMNALQSASDLISSNLTPMLATAKLSGFRKLMSAVVKYTQDSIHAKVKMPKINVTTSIPKDLIFNEVFEVQLTIRNLGEGDAFKLQLETTLPDDLEVLSGEKLWLIESLAANEERNTTFSLRYQTAVEMTESILELKGSLNFKDMLDNSHVQYFGPLTMEITAESKSTEYLAKLDGLKKEYEVISTDNEILNMFANQLHVLFENGIKRLEEEINLKEYEKADYGLSYLSDVVGWHRNFLSGDETAQQVVQSVETRVSQAKAVLKEELTKEYDTVKQKALSELERAKEEERNTALKQLEERLTSEYTEKINTLKEDHFKEIGKVNQMHENKFNRHMAEQEQQLESKFKQEMNEKTDKFELTLRDLQTQHEEELERERTQLREDLGIKHQKEIDSLQETKDEEIRKLNEAHEGALENALTTLKSQLKTQAYDELEAEKANLTRELMMKHERELDELERRLNKEIETKNQQIQDLERQLRDYKASSE